MTCKDCFAVLHQHNEMCRMRCGDMDKAIRLCPRHALNERLAEALRIAHYALHNSLNCGSGCDSSVLLAEYDDAKRGEL